MAPPDLRGLVRIGLEALNTTLGEKTKAILAQLGSTFHNTNESDDAIWWQHVGFASRPSKAIPNPGENGDFSSPAEGVDEDDAESSSGVPNGSAAQTVVVRGGGRDHVIASRDPRSFDVYGDLEPGETCVYAAGTYGKAQGRALFKKDGSIHLYTRKGNTRVGEGMTFQLDAQEGAIRATNDKGFGFIIDGDGVKLTAGGATLTLNADGSISLIGTKTVQIDPSVNIGEVTDPATDAVCCGPTGVASAAHPRLCVGKT